MVLTNRLNIVEFGGLYRLGSNGVHAAEEGHTVPSSKNPTATHLLRRIRPDMSIYRPEGPKKNAAPSISL